MSELELAPLATTTTVRANGATLAVESAGDGPAVAFLHAGVADRRSWRPVAAPLLADHHVVLWDRRGFGDTEVDGPGAVDHVADLLAVLDAVGIDRAALVGNSQGGRVALDATLEHPDRVTALMMVGAAWVGAPYPEDTPDVLALYEPIEQAEDAGDLDAVNRHEARFWLDGPGGHEGRVGGAARELFLDMNGRALRSGDVGALVPRDPAWPRLTEVTVPVSVVQGDLDEPSGTTVARQAAEILPDASFHLIEDTAHLPSLERPVVLASLVRDLVGRSEVGGD